MLLDARVKVPMSSDFFVETKKQGMESFISRRGGNAGVPASRPECSLDRDYVEKEEIVPCHFGTNERGDFWDIDIRTNNSSECTTTDSPSPHFVSRLALVLPRGVDRGDADHLENWLKSVTFLVDGLPVDTLSFKKGRSEYESVTRLFAGALRDAEVTTVLPWFDDDFKTITVPLTMGGAYDTLYLGCPGFPVSSKLRVRVECSWKLPAEPVLVGVMHYLKKDRVRSEPAPSSLSNTPEVPSKQVTDRLSIVERLRFQTNAPCTTFTDNPLTTPVDRSSESGVMIGEDTIPPPVRCVVPTYSFITSSTSTQTIHKVLHESSMTTKVSISLASNSSRRGMVRPCSRIPICVFFWIDGSQEARITRARLSIMTDTYWEGGAREMGYAKRRLLRGWSAFPPGVSYHVIPVQFSDFEAYEDKVEVELYVDVASKEDHNISPTESYNLNVSAVYPVQFDLTDDGKYKAMGDPWTMKKERAVPVTDKERDRRLIDGYTNQDYDNLSPLQPVRSPLLSAGLRSQNFMYPKAANDTDEFLCSNLFKTTTAPSGGTGTTHPIAPAAPLQRKAISPPPSDDDDDDILG